MVENKLEKNYSLFSAQYEKLYKKHLLAFIENAKQNPDSVSGDYTLFYPSCGSDNKKDIQFLIYGQAPNKWSVNFNPFDKNLTIDNIIDHSISQSNELDEKEPKQTSPLEWIETNWSENKFHRSYFWCVTFGIISSVMHNMKSINTELYKKFYYQSNSDWFKNFVWSNLAKIAPSVGGNPKGELMLQLEYSKLLFEKEIEEINPKYILLLTNWKNWAENYLTQDNYNIKHLKKNDAVDAIAYSRVTNSKILICKRPHKIGGHKRNSNAANEILKVIYDENK